MQERHGHTGTSSVKGCKGDEGAGTCIIQGEIERTGTVQPGKEKPQGRILIFCVLADVKE